MSMHFDLTDREIYVECSHLEDLGPYQLSIEGLEVGECYRVEAIEIHSWYTAVFLEGKTKPYNSVRFDLDLGPYIREYRQHLYG